MKKILLIGLLTLSSVAYAHGPHGYWRHSNEGRWHWMIPAAVGGIIVYEATRPPAPIVVQQPPVVQQLPPPVQGQNCSPWTQIQNPDGTITSTRTCY